MIYLLVRCDPNKCVLDPFDSTCQGDQSVRLRPEIFSRSLWPVVEAVLLKQEWSLADVAQVRALAGIEKTPNPVAAVTAESEPLLIYDSRSGNTAGPRLLAGRGSTDWSEPLGCGE